MLDKVAGFDWDEANVGHIFRHAVTPFEVEEVSGGKCLVIPARAVKREKRWKLFGKTASGRYLVVVFTIRRRLFRTVTAYEMPQRGVGMPRKSIKAMKLKANAEEADWYATPQGRRQTLREFARALKGGTLIRSTGSRIAKSDPAMLERLLEEAKRNATRSISIRLPIADLEHAQQIAEKTGVGYQTVLKQAIREGLKRAG